MLLLINIFLLTETRKVLNIGYIIGKVINDINLQFIYDKRRKSISKKHVTIVEIMIKSHNNIIYARAYDDIADDIYRKIKKEDFMIICGKVRSNYFEVLEILKL